MKRLIYLNNKIEVAKQSVRLAILSFLLLIYSNGLLGQTVSVNSPANCFAATFDFTLDTNNSPDATGRNVYFYSNTSLEVRFNNGDSRWEIKARGGNNDIYYINTFTSSPNPPDSNTSAWEDFGFCDTTGAPIVSGNGTQTTVGGNPCDNLGGDSDSDGACDDNDICAGFDDFADQDFDGIPDGCDANPTIPDGVLVNASCLDSNNPILFLVSGQAAGRNVYTNSTYQAEIRYNAGAGRWEIRANGGNFDVYLYNTYASFPNPPGSAGTWVGTSILNCDNSPSAIVSGSGTQDTLGCTITINTIDVTDPPCGDDGAITVTSSGAKGSVTYSLSGPSSPNNNTGVFNNLSAGLYTITVSDGAFPSGVCTASDTRTLTVQDATAPSISCPTNITVNNDPGQCGAIVSYEVPVGTDNCNGAITTLTAGLGSGEFFPVGTTTETYRVTDGSGNVVDCSFTVTVTDNEPRMATLSAVPDIVCNGGNTKIYLNASGGTEPYNVTIQTSEGQSTTRSMNNGDFVELGPISVGVLNVFLSSGTDANGCTLNVTNSNVNVTGVQDPIITCPADVTLQCGDSTDPSATGRATAIEGCGLVDITFTDSFIPGCGNTGAILREWTATDEEGGLDRCTQTITIIDNTAPVLTVPGDVTLECFEGDPQNINRLTVNSPGGIAGDYLTAYASFGPLLTSVPVTADLQLANDGSGITSDACESPLADLAGKIALIDRGTCTFVSKALNAQNAGALAVIIVNNSGTDVVTTLGGSDPTITIPSVMVSKDTGDALKAALLLGSVNVTLSDPEIIVSDNCGAVPVVSSSRTIESGSCANSFTIIITWTATDVCGKVTSASQTITIEDKTAPDLTVVAETTIECSDESIPFANRLTVNSVSGAGDYLTGIGTFAAQLNSAPLTANLALDSSDGCLPLLNVVGKVALIDRGNCTFADKVRNAKDAGALAVIIANNDTVNPDKVINVAGPYEVQLPMVFVSYNTGLALKTAMLTGTVNVSLYDNDITVNDNCDVSPIIMISDTETIPGTCNNEGDIIYTYTATDLCGNSSSSIRTIQIIDNTPPEIVCLDQGPYTRSAETGLCAYKVVADEFDATATDNCSSGPALSWVITNPDAASQNGMDTLADVELPSGLNTITWTADDGCGNTSSCSFIVNVDKIVTVTSITVTPDSQQYSDKVTFDVTVTPGDCSGAGQAAGYALIYVGNQLMGNAILYVNGLGNLEGTLDASLLENPNFNGEMSPGLKTVKAVFMDIDPNYTVNDTTTDLTITQENALVDYTGQSLQATPSSSSSTATVVLSANIQDIADGYRGDIRNAKVMFVNRDSNTPISGWIPVVNLIDPSDPTLGTVSFNWPVNIGASNAISYTVGIIVGDDGYYIRNAPEDDTVITVYKPVGDFITGGGHIRPDASAGQYASTDGLKTNFGFNVGYNKKGNKLKGHMNIIFRRLENDGIVHVYQIKANAIQSLGVDISNPDAKFATFTTKTNLTDITDPLNPISLGGNLILKVEMTDRGEPGTYDSISFNLTDGGTLIYSSNWTGISTQEMVLSAGNLLVHSGYSVAKISETTASEEDTDTFDLQSWPNPSEDEFKIRLNTANKTDNIEINVFDINGRLVYHKKGNPNEEHHFGQSFNAGVYFVKVTQANKSSQARLVKY